MSIEIVVPSERMSQILSDLSKRRATILDVESRGESNKVLTINSRTYHASHIKIDFISFRKSGSQCTSTTSRIKRLFDNHTNDKFWCGSDEHATAWVRRHEFIRRIFSRSTGTGLGMMTVVFCHSSYSSVKIVI